jgi:CheY-like chemotaxis protein
MTGKHILIIDDDDQKDVIKALQDEIRVALKLNLNVTFIDLSEPELLNDETGALVREKLEQHILSEIKGKHFDLLACDYQFGDEEISGLDVIDFIKTRRTNLPVFLYTGAYDKVIGDLVKKLKEGVIDDDEFVKLFKKFFNGRIDKFIKRANYNTHIIDFFRHHICSLEQHLVKRILDHKELEFKSCYPKLRGNTLEVIADEISSSSSRGVEFREELLEQTISYLVETNE